MAPESTIGEESTMEEVDDSGDGVRGESSTEPSHATRSGSKWLFRGLITLVILAAAVLGGRFLLGVHTVRAGVPPGTLGVEPLDHRSFDRVVRRVVYRGEVDYQSLRNRTVDLRRYVAKIELIGPNTAPERFPDDRHEMAWYINAYNAAVLLGVMRHYPIDSVHDVHGPLSVSPGLGFFWAQRFMLDGREVNLFDFENEMRERFGDARIHAAINCASVSCPPLHDRAFVADKIEEQLDEVTRAWVNDPEHVLVNEDQDKVVLNPIFDWFREDFETHIQELNGRSSLLDWIAFYADEEQADALERAKASGYGIEFYEYDWALNRSR